jgi:hypothetical protein
VTPTSDARGARGSNAGDQFHELWALEQALGLLEPSTALEALTVEGVIGDSPDGHDTEPHWDGVDCALYFGGQTLTAAERVELVQLKYSTNPDREWSVARLTQSSARKGSNSPLKRLAQAFVAARSSLKAGAALQVRFVSNQSVASGMLELIEAATTGKLADERVAADLLLVASATGLVGETLQRFLAALDCSECGQVSRFAVRERLIVRIASLIEDNAASVEADLRQHVRDLMLPERAREVVTSPTLLSWFGIADSKGLFPCPPATVSVVAPIIRDAAVHSAARLASGVKLLCLHGPGGCGKTTAVQELLGLLPPGSCVVVFDCYGAGRYRFSDDKRHLPTNAYLQITNDLAVMLRTPFFLARDTRNPIEIQRFLHRLTQSASVVSSRSTDALLVVAIDAADNAVTAAELGQGDPCFVHELCGADLDSLPSNVRILLSARTAQLPRLRLPRAAERVECAPFSLAETAHYVQSIWPTASTAWTTQFHELSHGIPRVQAYALGVAKNSMVSALDALRPTGKALKDVLRTRFDQALRKLGREDLFDTVVAGLAVLPPPIPLHHLAAVAETTPDAITDLVHDLLPGVRNESDGVVVADEDFEDFIKAEAHRPEALERLRSTRDAVASQLLGYHDSDAYAAIHVAEALVEAGRGNELLPLLEAGSAPAAVVDPITRREVQLRRLRLALSVCRRAGKGHTPDALKVVLLSADAERDEATLRELLSKETDLAVQFAWPTLRRLVLTDRESVAHQGSVLARDAARAARANDPITARERLASHDAWLRRQRELREDERRDWAISDDDIISRSEAIFELSGTAGVLSELKGWRPRDIPLRVALKLVPLLIARGRQESVIELLTSRVLPEPWSLLLAVPLAQAGYSVDGSVIEQALKRLRRRHVPRVRDIDSWGERQWRGEYFQLLLTACELAVALGVDRRIALQGIRLLRNDHRSSLTAVQDVAIDAAFRHWLLERHLAEMDISADAFLAWLEEDSTDPTSPVPSKRDPEKNRGERHNELKAVSDALFPIYAGRLALIVNKTAAAGDSVATRVPSVDASMYRFDRIHWSTHLRQRAADSVVQLIAVPGLPPRALLERATTILEGYYPDILGARALPLLRRLTLRREDHQIVHEIAIAKAQATREARIPSSEKVASFISLSRLLLPIAPDDARELFTSAVDIAKEIDREAYDQIDLLASWAVAATALDERARRDLAAAIDCFVTEAAERISSHYEGYPWSAAASSLARIALPVGLASVARWADSGIASLESTLGPLLITAVTEGTLSPATVVAMAIVLDEPDQELVKAVLVAATNAPVASGLRAELARDCLLQTSVGRRESVARTILSLAPEEEVKAEGALNQLRQTLRFVDGLSSQQSACRTDATATSLDGSSGAPWLDGLDLNDAAVIQTVVETRAANLSGPQLDDVFRALRNNVALSKRVAFLDAVTRIELTLWNSYAIANAIVDCLEAWKESPAVRRWSTEVLPTVVVSRFAVLARWLKEGQSALPRLLAAACPSSADRLRVLTEGLEASGLALGNRTLYATAELIVADMQAVDAAPVLQWYVERLVSRITPGERRTLELSEVPLSAVEAVGRFVYALLADIDTRIRWRAAHIVRRLARMNVTDVFDSIIANWSRMRDAAYREPGTPFYWLAARLWLMMALNRSSREAPGVVGRHTTFLATVAIDNTFPHVLIREHAKQSALFLMQHGYGKRGIAVTALRGVNTSRFRRKRVASPDDDPPQDLADSSSTEFDFDYMDTQRYWYSDLPKLFPGTTMKEVLSRASRWIVHAWGAPKNANRWDTEPRKQRYDERRWSSYSHSQGSLPVMERYGTHLEWHAMLCVTGELLLTRPLSDAKDSPWVFEEWLARLVPTSAGHWISDIREYVPLERRFWVPDSREDTVWLESSDTQEFLEELEVVSNVRPGWIVVAGGHKDHFSTRMQEVRTSSALVSPATASALVRALETAQSPYDFRIPWENDEFQIREGPFRLAGWLAMESGEMAFDQRDPLRKDARPLIQTPGHLPTRVLDLGSSSDIRGRWLARGRRDPCIAGEVWSDLGADSDDDDRRRPRPGSNGWRIWIQVGDLRRLLDKENSDLIVEVLIDRRLHSEYSNAYDPDPKKKKTVYRILVCRRDGRIEGATGDLGSWAEAR